jgi:hypothetical protein
MMGLLCHADQTAISGQIAEFPQTVEPHCGRRFLPLAAAV